MNPSQENSNSRTLTNPKLFNQIGPNSVSNNQFQVKQQEPYESPILLQNQNLFLHNQPADFPVKRENSPNQSAYFNSAFKMYSSPSKVYNQPQKSFLNRETAQKSKKILLETHQNSQTHFEELDLAQEFIMPDVDFQKDSITITITESLLKNPKQNFSTNEESQNEEDQRNGVKMEIEHPESIQSDHHQEQNQSKFRTLELTFHLSDPKQKRQIRRLTPIKSLKKFILQKFSYSSGAQNCTNLQLFFYNLYPGQSPLITLPINNEENLELILTEYLKARKHIFITFENDGSLKKKIERKPKPNDAYQIQFDSDGQLEDEDLQSAENQNQNQEEGAQVNEIKMIKNMIMVNKTQKSRYRGTNLVRCAFCQKTNKDIESIKICGPFYGPFIQRNKKTKNYCHLLCALWCKKVFLNEKNELQKIPMQIGRSQKKMCEYCDNYGAGLLCKGCNAAMHYECGLDKCQYLWVTYELYCLKCKEQEQAQDLEIQMEQIAFDEDQKGQSNPAEVEIEIDGPSNHMKTNMEIQRGQEYEVKRQADPQESMMVVEKVIDININSSYSISEESKTKSIPVPRLKQPEPQNILAIDPASKFDINGSEFEQSESVQILENKCKPAKNKSSFDSNIKNQESKLLGNNDKPRRGRPRKNKNEKN